MQNESSRVENETLLWARLKPLRDKIAAYPKTGLQADKEFFEEIGSDD